jgi:glutamate synthase (NADPH/NADH) small chain
MLTYPVRFIGTRRVEAVECIKMQLGKPDESGRRRPEPVPGSEFQVPADTVIKAIGQKKHEDFFKQIAGLETEWGQVKVSDRYQCTNPKYFAGGDCISGGGTVVEAVKNGKLAARNIDRYLRGEL